MESWRERVLVDPDICHGQAVIKGTRIMVWLLVSMFAEGQSVEEVLEAYPQLVKEDVLAALEAGDLKGKKLGKAYRISKEALLAFLND